MVKSEIINRFVCFTEGKNKPVFPGVNLVSKIFEDGGTVDSTPTAPLRNQIGRETIYKRQYLQR